MFSYNISFHELINYFLKKCIRTNNHNFFSFLEIDLCKVLISLSFYENRKQQQTGSLTRKHNLANNSYRLPRSDCEAKKIKKKNQNKHLWFQLFDRKIIFDFKWSFKLNGELEEERDMQNCPFSADTSKVVPILMRVNRWYFFFRFE